MTKPPYDVQEPDQIARLPRDARGYPVPWFIAWLEDGESVDPPNGKPDFRVIAPGKVLQALGGLCWLCGQPLGRYKAYVVGPMCAVNRTSAEPPSHVSCARFAAQACPFLTTPKRTRQDLNKVEGTEPMPGIMLDRNPGVALVWVITGKPKLKSAPNGFLFDLSEPDRCEWYAEGREATRAEVEESIDSGLPILREMAEHDGRGAIRELERLTASARQLLPA